MNPTMIYILTTVISFVAIGFLLYEFKGKILPFGMATIDPTAIGDIDYQSEAFKDTLTAEITDALGFLSSGILTEIPRDMITSEGAAGDFGNVPQWKTFSGTMTPIASGTEVDINNLSTYKQRFPWLHREYAVGAEDIVKMITGADTLGEVAKKLGPFLARTIQAMSINALKGAFATALATSHSTGAAYTSGTINVTAANAARLLLGDNLNLLNKMISHSKVTMDGVNLMIASYGTQNRDELKSGKLPQFLGMENWMDDTLTAVATIYSSFFSEAGSIGYSFAPWERTDVNGQKFSGMGVDIEPYRLPNLSGGVSSLIIRLHCMVHLNGMAYNSATKNPSNAQLATGSNWTKVVDDDKKIRIVELKTK